MDDPPSILPEYSAVQSQELERIAFLLAEMRSLLGRGLVSAEAVATVEGEKAPRRAEIERLGLASGAMTTARDLAADPQRWHEALALAERARCLAPERVEGWLLSADLLGRLGEYDRALAIYEEGGRLHDHRDLKEQAAACEARRREHDRKVAAAQAVTRAREAAESGEYEEALATSREVLRLDRRHPGMRAVEVRSLAALGRLDEAEAANAVLRDTRPVEAAEWAMKLRRLRDAAAIEKTKPAASPEIAWRGEREHDGAADTTRAAIPPPAIAADVAHPRPGLAAVAAEFLEEHWQKLILALAVLLIVVSSTVGAAMVLGDRLWMAEGKCLLATAYTVLFAAFGRGLGRWGAVRAGQIMRLTALMVLPVSFALVGELPGLGRSSLASLAVLAVDSAAMMGLIWVVCRSLGVSGGRMVPSALIAMGMINALTSRSATFAWGLSAMLAACCVFAVAAEWLGARQSGGEAEAGSDFFAFGILAFYFACAIGRIGGYVLGVPPTLYALPAMLAAAAAVRMADGLSESGGPGRTVALVRLGGFALSALAFALGLSRPPTRLPLYSGNTLVAALLGLGMYGRALWKERRPAFLYAAFAALFLAYFGMHEFIKDVYSPVEGRIGRMLGYDGKLPAPFRGLNGLLFNAGLAGLAIVFRRRWKDDRLALHCHAIGLPLSVAACILSAFEPLAAVLTMGGYAVAFGLGVWLFAAPSLGYLACVAFAGAAVAGSSYMGDLAAGGWSLALATVGMVLWVACRVVSIEKAPPAYRDPIVRSARVAAAVALIFAGWAAMDSEGSSWTASAALWVLAVLYVLIGLETPRETIAYAVGGCVAVASTITIRLASARFGGPVGLAIFAPWPAFLGVLYQAIGPWLRGIADRGEAVPGHNSPARAYPTPLFHLGLILSATAVLMACSRWIDRPAGVPELMLIAATLAMVTAGLVIASARTLAHEGLAYAALLSGSCGAIATTLGVAGARGVPTSPSTLALTVAGLVLSLAILGDLARSRGPAWVVLYRRPILHVTLLAIVASWLIGGMGWQDARPFAASLALTAIALAVATRQRPTRPLPDLALLAGLSAWLVACGATRARGLDALPRLGLLVLAYGLAVLAAAEIARRLSRGLDRGMARRSFSSAMPEFVAVSTLAAIAMGGFSVRTGDYASLTPVLGLSACVSLWLLRWRHEAWLIHAGLILAWLATCSGSRWAVGDHGPGIVLGWVALASAIDALILVILRATGRARGPFFLDPLRDVGVFLAVATFGLAVAGSSSTLDAYPMAVAALLVLVAGLLLSAVIDRSPWRVYGAIFVVVASAYLTMFFLGRGRQGHVSALGVLASLLAIAFWGLERLASRKAKGDWRGVFAVPPRDATIALSILAIPPDWGAPRAMLLASLPFLLLIRMLPASGWLYPSLALIVGAGAFSAFDRWGLAALVLPAVATALACGAIGLAVGKWKPGVCRRLGLPDGPPFDLPFVHSAMALERGGHRPAAPRDPSPRGTLVIPPLGGGIAGRAVPAHAQAIPQPGLGRWLHRVDELRDAGVGLAGTDGADGLRGHRPRAGPALEDGGRGRLAGAIASLLGARGRLRSRGRPPQPLVDRPPGSRGLAAGDSDRLLRPRDEPRRGDRIPGRDPRRVVGGDGRDPAPLGEPRPLAATARRALAIDRHPCDVNAGGLVGRPARLARDWPIEPGSGLGPPARDDAARADLDLAGSPRGVPSRGPLRPRPLPGRGGPHRRPGRRDDDGLPVPRDGLVRADRRARA